MEKRNKSEIIIGEVNKKDSEKSLRWDWLDIGVLGDKNCFNLSKRLFQLTMKVGFRIRLI